MIPRSIFINISKTHQPISQSSLLNTTLQKRSNLLRYFHPFSSLQGSGVPNLANHRDWLSPNEVVKIFERLKDPNFTLPVFNQISNRKDYKPNEDLYTAVIKKLAEAKDFDAIESLMERIKVERKCRLSEDFFYNVIKIYGHLGGRINSAMNTLFDMPNYKCWPTVKTFNFVLNLLVSTKQFDVVHKVYKGASKLGVEVDACSLNIVIKGLCAYGELDAAFSMLDEFSKQNFRPNVRTLSSLIRGLCDSGRISEAFELLNTMEKDGVEPDAIIYNILMSGLRKHRIFDEATELFNKMLGKGCDPNPGTYQEVLYCLLDAEKFVEAKDFMLRMINKRMNPSFESYKSIIGGFCKQRLVGDLDWALRQMIRHGFVPKMGMWKMIVQCIVSTNNVGVFSYENLLKDG